MVTFLKLLLKQGIMGSPTPSYSGKSIQIISTQQPNRILIHKPILIRLVIPEEVVVELCLTVSILVLQAEGLVCVIRYLGFLFQTTPAGVFSVPQQIAVLIGHLSRDTDLVAVEVVGLSAVSPYSLMLFRKMKPLTFVPRIPCVRTKDFV